MRYPYIIIFFCLPFFIMGQGGFRTRPMTPPGINSYSKFIFETSPGSYIAGGIISDTLNGVGINRIAISGINSTGQVLWTKKYGDENLQYVFNPFVTRIFFKHGNYLYHAYSVLGNTNRYRGALVKFNLNGDTLWQKFYLDQDTLEDVIPQMVTASVDGGFLITGFFQNWSSNPYSKCLLIKTDANGNELWRKKIGKVAPNVQDGKAITQDSASKKIVIVGYQFTGLASSPDMQDNVLILDSLGNKLGQYNYAGFGGYSVDLIQTKDKKFVVVGRSIYPQTIGGDNLVRSFAAKFDVNSPSVPLWKIDNFDKLELNNYFHCIRELKNEDLLIGGFIDTMQLHNLPTNCLTRITKIDKNGNVKWNKYYDYKTNDSALDNNQSIVSIELASDGGWLAAMQVLNSSAPNPFFFVKYDSTGCDSSAAHCATLNLVGVEETKADNTKLKIFPNPVRDFLSFKTTYTEEMEVYVTDVLGREVKRLTMTQNNKIDVRDLENGMYLITICHKNEIINKTKIIKE